MHSPCCHHAVRVLTLTAALTASSPMLLAQGQFNERWASFRPAPAALSGPAPISDDDHETDIAWGDLDADGDIDVVVARKQPFTTAGKRSNVLLVNESGVLTDRSAALAASSDVPGDSGFSTPTNDRDIVLGDVNNDGFLDAVTAADMTSGEPKHISHPRVYVNQGLELGGAWLGLRFESARTPQIFHALSGVPLDPRFTTVSAGDADLDGSLDLYFGDHDTELTLFGALEPPAQDSNDRLLLNNGSGFFNDASATSMTPAMLDSGFCNSAVWGDFNGDGTLDLMKQVTYSDPPSIRIAYNDPTAPGQFVFNDVIYAGTPYFINTGDLNNDGRLDVAVTQNQEDKYLLNTGLTGFGSASWSAPLDFEFLTGAKIGFTYHSNNLIVDLDGDGWNEVLIADVDPEFPEYADGFRLNLYHNRGGTPGGTDIVLREERASTSDASWVGADGLLPSDLRWTHDVGVFDVDGDGARDLLLSRREGTQVWLQQPPPVCQEDLGFGFGEPVLEVCGGDLSSGNDATLRLFDGPPDSITLAALSTSALPFFEPVTGATLVPNPILSILTLGTDATGQFSLELAGGLGPATFVVQFVIVSPNLLTFSPSNAVQIEFKP